VTEPGTIQNRDRLTLKSEVEGTTTIIRLVEEGTKVQKGDLLVQLDASDLLGRRDQQQITVMNAEASFIRARENLAVVQSQAQSDVDAAELALNFAKQDLKKYQEGEYPRALQQAQVDIQLATEKLQRAQDTLDWSRRLAEDGYITRTELQADKLAAQQAKVNLDLAQTDLKLLQEYTHDRDLKKLTSDVTQAERALERVRRKAAADIVQAKADLKAKESEFHRQQDRLEKVKTQIEKCRIVAPRPGTVVYATTGRSRWRRSEPLEEGQQVRERQELIILPSSSAMQVDLKVPEASLRKIKVGMPVRVTTDAVPDQEFWGRVSKISHYPDPFSSWLNPDLKLYSTEVHLDDNSGQLRAGMSCTAEIIVEQYDKALYVPMQCVVQVNGRPTVYVTTPEGVQKRVVETGLDNNQQIRILQGLAAGEKVLLNPPLAESTTTSQNGQTKVPDHIRQPTATPKAPPREEATDEAPAAPTQPDQPASTDLRSMTPEQRRAYFQNLTPEQREALRARRRQRGGQRPGGEGENAGRRRRREQSETDADAPAAEHAPDGDAQSERRRNRQEQTTP